MSSPLFRSVKKAATAGGTSLATAEPTGATTDDIIDGLWVVETGHTGFSLPASWTPKGANLATAQFTSYRGWIRRTGSAPSYTATWTGTSAAEAVVAAYSGCVTTGDPYDDFQETTQATSTAGPTAPAATSTLADTIFLMHGAHWAGSSSAWGTTDGSTIRSGASGDDIGLSTIAEATATTFTPAVFTGFGGFTGTRYGCTSVLKPVPSGGPTISVQPASTQIASGATANFSITAAASGGGTLSYQWKLGGTNVSTGSGGTTASYTTAALGYADDGGSYTCEVTETGGSSPGLITSSAAIAYVGTRVVGAGTPVYSTSGGTTVAPSYSTLPTILANDAIYLVIAQKPSAANGGTVSAITGYTLVATLGAAGGYGATLGNNTGNTNLYIYRKDTVAGTESGTLTVTVGTNGVCSAVFVLLRPVTGYTLSEASASGSDTTAGNVSITAGSDPGEGPGDIALFTFNGASALATYSAQAITTTSVTYGAVTVLASPSTTVGNDVAGFVASAPVVSGTSTGAPVFAATTGGTTTNARGPGIVVRIRAAPPSTQNNALLMSSVSLTG